MYLPAVLHGQMEKSMRRAQALSRKMQRILNKYKGKMDQLPWSAEPETGETVSRQ